MKTTIGIDAKVVEAIRNSGWQTGCDEWLIASSVYQWDSLGARPKHGAWIRVIINACIRLEQARILGHFFVSHGEGVAGTRVWFIRKSVMDLSGHTGAAEGVSAID